jgi:hypothetical protein
MRRCRVELSLPYGFGSGGYLPPGRGDPTPREGTRCGVRPSFLRPSWGGHGGVRVWGQTFAFLGRSELLGDVGDEALIEVHVPSHATRVLAGGSEEQREGVTPGHRHHSLDRLMVVQRSVPSSAAKVVVRVGDPLPGRHLRRSGSDKEFHAGRQRVGQRQTQGFEFLLYVRSSDHLEQRGSPDAHRHRP